MLQDLNDEPASELLKQIAAEKVRLVKAGEIRKPKQLPAIDEPPYRIPDSWCWLPIREATSDRGQSVPQSSFTYIDVTAIDKEKGLIANPRVLESNEAPSRARKIVRKGDVVYSCVRPYLLNVAVVEGDFDPLPIASTAFAVLDGHGLVLPWFQWIVLRSPFMVSRVEEEMRGQAYPAINETDFARLPFPLPPLAEQHRIVAKVDELMALCDRLEAARAEREATRDRLAMVSRTRLDAPDPDPARFQHDVAFALNNLGPLTTRPDQIKALRQTILNLAVRGKLMPQDPNDEPASALITRARADMSLLVKSGDVAKMKAVGPIRRTDQLFPLPTGWQWVRMGEISRLITKGSSPKWQGIEYVDEECGVLFITSENVDNYTLMKMNQPKYVEARFNQIEPRSILQKGDILLNLVGASIGRSALFDLERTANINQAVAIIRPIHQNVHIVSSYLLHYLNSPVCLNEMLGSRAISAQPNISLTDTRNFLIPLPPHAEQHRIVAKVDELMTFCGRLEASLATGDETRCLSVEALLSRLLSDAKVNASLLDSGISRNREDNT